MKSTAITALITVIFLVVPFAAQADVVTYFGSNATFQDIFFGDYTGRNGDIEGHAAIKGNVDAYNYGFGSGQQNLHTTGPVLVVGGNVKSSGSGVFDGNGYIAGKSTTYAQGETVYGKDGKTAYAKSPYKNDFLGAAGTGGYNTLDPSYRGTPGTITTGYDTSKIIDFAAAEAELRQISNGLWSLADTVEGTVQSAGSRTRLTIDMATNAQTGLQSITVDVSLLNKLSYKDLVIKAQADTTLIINVTDTTGMGYLNLYSFMINDNYAIEETLQHFDFDGSNILFNIQAALEINVIGAEIDASFMALDSNFTVAYGDIGGQVFANSAYTQDGGEFHNYFTFDDKHLSNNVTPEPASMLIFGLGLAGIPFLRRKKRQA